MDRNVMSAELQGKRAVAALCLVRLPVCGDNTVARLAPLNLDRRQVPRGH